MVVASFLGVPCPRGLDWLNRHTSTVTVLCDDRAALAYSAFLFSFVLIGWGDTQKRSWLLVSVVCAEEQPRPPQHRIHRAFLDNSRSNEIELINHSVGSVLAKFVLGSLRSSARDSAAAT